MRELNPMLVFSYWSLRTVGLLGLFGLLDGEGEGPTACYGSHTCKICNLNSIEPLFSIEIPCPLNFQSASFSFQPSTCNGALSQGAWKAWSVGIALGVAAQMPVMIFQLKIVGLKLEVRTSNRGCVAIEKKAFV